MKSPVKALPLLIAAACGLPMCSAQQWVAPTPEELTMTSIKEVPGAAAVYLNKDEETDDAMHAHSFYVRLKVLTDKGKEYANVELPYYAGEGTRIDQIEGRTIHPDGTIIPFSGKPYEKLIAKNGHDQVKAKVFTLPSVEVGSIIEYRYKLRLDDIYFSEPSWMIQSDLYTRKAHYMWRPTEHQLVNEKGESISGAIEWAPILPPGAEIKHSKVLSTGTAQLDLDVHDIPPLPHEDFMPPINSVSYRVLFYYTPYHSMQEFWTSTGKKWSRDTDKFVGPSGKVADYAKSLVGASDTEDLKARKLYAAVMAMENTDFTRERTTREEKAQGFRDVKNTDDVMKQDRGTGDQLTLLFVAMARAVGLKAYVMGVADRNERLWIPMYTSMRQVDAYVAIVQIDGKEVFFDPGERYCEPEHLSWHHASTGGIRQTDGGTAQASTPGESYKVAHTTRIADLKLDDHGEAKGTVKVTYTGDPALRWRHVSLSGDETTLKDDLKSSMEKSLPGGMDVKVVSIDHLKEYDKPFSVIYEVTGAVGSSTGKRLLVPADLFEVNAKPRFPEAKRDVAVDMHYATDDQDAVRYTLPEGIVVESAPEPVKEKFQMFAAYDANSVKAANAVTSYRNLALGQAIFLPKEYDDLKSFYGKLETKDQETIVLTRAAAVTATTKSGGN